MLNKLKPPRACSPLLWSLLPAGVVACTTGNSSRRTSAQDATGALD